jgi:hypothetical protein
MANWFTPIAAQSTYTANMSKESGNIDILVAAVDAIDTSQKYVDKMSFYRHIMHDLARSRRLAVRGR